MGSMPTAMSTIGGMGGAGDFVIQLTIKQQLVPDPEHLYVLQYHPGTFYSDRLNIQLTPNGMLRSIFTTGLKESTFSSGSASYSGYGGTMGGSSYGSGGYGSSSYGSPYGSSSYGSPYGNSPYPSYSPGMGSPGTPGQPPPEADPLAVGPPLQLALSTSDLSTAPIPVDLFRQDLTTLKGKHAYLFSPDAPQVVWTVEDPRTQTQGRLGVRLTAINITVPDSPATAADVQKTATVPNGNKGVKFKIAQAYQVTFTLFYAEPQGQAVAELAQVRTLALMPNQSEIYTLPLDRYLLVESTLNAAFQNGQLTGWGQDKPSFPQNVAAIPLDILGALFDALKGIGTAGARAATGPMATSMGAGAGIGMAAN
jgi:hypothetical protein